jgi:hypothetical protein
MTEEQIVSVVVKAIAQQQIPQPWYMQYNLVSIALVGAVGYIAWSAKTFFETFTSSIKDLYEKNNDKEKRLSHVEGVCSSNHCRRSSDVGDGSGD